MILCEVCDDAIYITPCLSIGRDGDGDFYIDFTWLAMSIVWWPLV